MKTKGCKQEKRNLTYENEVKCTNYKRSQNTEGTHELRSVSEESIIKQWIAKSLIVFHPPSIYANTQTHTQWCIYTHIPMHHALQTMTWPECKLYAHMRYSHVHTSHACMHAYVDVSVKHIYVYIYVINFQERSYLSKQHYRNTNLFYLQNGEGISGFLLDTCHVPKKIFF